MAHYAQNQTPTALKFLVVGAGLSGVSAAYALRKAGHDVLVLDRRSDKIKSKGSLQCPPNMTKVLQRWGLGPMLAQKSHKCSKFIFANGNSGTILGSILLDEEFLRDLAADFMFIQHQDLYDILFTASRQAGVEFRTNCSVLDADIDNVAVTLDSGEVLKGDVIIGADGHDSFLRNLVTGAAAPEDDDCERDLVLTFTLPWEALHEEEGLMTLLSSRDWIIWMGEGYIMHGSLFNEGTEFTATMMYKCTRPRWPGDETWSSQHDLEFYQLDMDQFESRIQKLLRLAKTISARTYRARRSPEDLVCRQARLVLIGSAAHPLMPGTNHATASSLEDSFTLGYLFSRLRAREQMPQILTAYEEIRQPWTSWVHEYDFHHVGSMRCTVEHQKQRDERIRQTLVCDDWDHMEEELFKTVWANELDIFAYDVAEKAEDWWRQWGCIISGRGTGTTEGNCEVVVTNSRAPPLS